MAHNLFENALSTLLASGTFIGASFGGTAAGVAPAGEYEYHSVRFIGTIANHGTINVYGVTNTAGSSPRLIASLPVGSGNGAGAVIDIKSDVLGTFAASGTNYPYIAAAGTVESGGTWRGALEILSTWPRTAGTTSGALNLVAYGTALS